LKASKAFVKSILVEMYKKQSNVIPILNNNLIMRLVELFFFLLTAVGIN